MNKIYRYTEKEVRKEFRRYIDTFSIDHSELILQALNNYHRIVKLVQDEVNE